MVRDFAMSPERQVIGLIEDDPIMGESLTQRLTLEGARVHWWRTKTEALKGLQFHDPDVVICDLRLPDGSGEDVFAEAKRRQCAKPFLFMTAYSDIDQAVRLMRAGAGDYVTKPFEMSALLRRLASIAPAAFAHQTHSLKSARGEAEKSEIERTLHETQGRLGEAARRLDISRTTLWARMKTHGIDRKSFRRSEN
jgi:DNA-binding NtrC family response regulator